MYAPRTKAEFALTNRLLIALPRAEFDRLAPHLEQVSFPKDTILYDVGDVVRHAYFLQSGMISLLSVTDEEDVIEIGAVGFEGMIGIPSVLPNKKAALRTLVQIPISALQIKADTLSSEFKRCEKLRELLLGYTHTLVTQIAQSIACNHYHPIEKRLCRWLLMTRDCVGDDTFNLTHEFISYMLGATRTGVTEAAGMLQEQGLIHYRRGKITILNRKALEAAACNCYRITKDDSEHSIAA